MPEFIYKAYDSSGLAVKGRVNASSKSAAMDKLKEDNLHILSLDKYSEPTQVFSRSSKNLKLADLEFLTSEISLLLKNGIKIDKGLSLLAKGRQGTAVGRLLNEMSASVKRGLTLSSAMEEHKVFDALYISIIKIGEETGQLAEVFEGLAEDLKFKKSLRNKIIQSITYPSVILVVCILVILLVFNFIVPQMSGLFEGNESLPIYTSVLLALSDWMQKYQIWLLIFVVSGAFVLRSLYKDANKKGAFDEFILKIPVLGSATVQVESIRFNNSMAIMLEAGIKVDRAIGLAANNVRNSDLRKVLINARDKIKRGHAFSESVKNSKLYPELMCSLLEVGEESGDLGSVFREIARRNKESFENWTTKITSLLEPLMILFMGGIVGSVVVVMLLSIMTVNEGL